MTNSIPLNGSRDEVEDSNNQQHASLEVQNIQEIKLGLNYFIVGVCLYLTNWVDEVSTLGFLCAHDRS